MSGAASAIANQGSSHVARGAAPPGRWRLLAPALALWGIAAVAIALPGSGSWIVVSALGGTCLALASTVRWKALRRALGTILLWCGLFLLLGIRIMDGEGARSDPVSTSAVRTGEMITVEARLSGYGKSTTDTFGSLHWAVAQVTTASGSAPALLWLEGPLYADLGPGSVLQVTGRVAGLPPADAAAFSIRVSEWTPSRQVSWWSSIGSTAASMRSLLRAHAEAVSGVALLPGFAVGDTSLIGQELDASMRETSLTHVTAVSGANCALVTGAVLWLLGRAGLGRRGRIAVAAIALGGFVILVGPDPSVRRAAVMAAVMLVSGFGGKRAVALPALGLAVILMLLISPWQALQAGFALSVAATLGILLAATPLQGRLRSRLRVPAVLALPLAVTLGAQLACGPLLLLLQPGLPVVGVPANVLVAPAIPFATGLGLIATVLGPVHSELATLILQLARPFAQWVETVATHLAAFPFARWHWPEGWIGALLLLLCQCLVLLAWALARGRLSLPGIAIRTPRSPWSRTPAPALASALVVSICGALASGIAVGTVLVTPVLTRLSTPGDWGVVMCDVGQGDALLLRAPERPGEVLVVDTGDDPAALTSCLDRFQVERISLLVLSHDDRDHTGALAAIISRVDRALIAPTAYGQTEQQRRPLQMLVEAQVPVTIADEQLRSGRTHADGGLRWRILAPRVGVTPESTNAASLVMSVEIGALRVLLLGDTARETQEALLTAHPGLRADVVKVAHHGSRDQSAELYRSLSPKLALISVGAGNRYGHPARATLRLLGELGVTVLRTDRSGMIALSMPEGGGVRLWEERLAATSTDGAASVSAVSPKLASWPQRNRRSPSSGMTPLVRRVWCC